MASGFSRAALAALSVVVCLVGAVGNARAQSHSDEWLSVDVGNPSLSGSAERSGSTFQIAGAGVEIGGRKDQFHFVYQTFTGDFEISARVDRLSDMEPLASAGVMIRRTLAADSPHAFAFISAMNGTGFQRRYAAGGQTALTQGPGRRPPYSVRIVRKGTTVTAYVSETGEWVEVGKDTVDLGSTVYVGLAVNSRRSNARAFATVSDVQLQPLSAGTKLLSVDVGKPKIKGSTIEQSGRYTIEAGGADVWGTADEFHFVYQPAQGDVDVTAFVDSVSPGNPWSKAGVMIRESLDPASAHASTFVSSIKGSVFRRRAAARATTEDTAGGSVRAPYWVRIARKGDVIESFQSPDGQNWTLVGSDVVAMSTEVLVGIAVTSRQKTASTTAVVEQLRVSSSSEPADLAPVVAVTSPDAGSSSAGSTPVEIAASASDPDGSIAAVEFYIDGILAARLTQAPYVYTAILPAGTHVIQAHATDNTGKTTISESVDLNVVPESKPDPTDPPVPPVPSGSPHAVAFDVNSDLESEVQMYILEVHRAGKMPGKDTPIATMNLGRPIPDSRGEVLVECGPFFQGLPTGEYVATVVAVGQAGSGRSNAASFTR